jgi:hypothetical protein
VLEWGAGERKPDSDANELRSGTPALRVIVETKVISSDGLIKVLLISTLLYVYVCYEPGRHLNPKAGRGTSAFHTPHTAHGSKGGFAGPLSLLSKSGTIDQCAAHAGRDHVSGDQSANSRKDSARSTNVSYLIVNRLTAPDYSSL